jgi:hypothetical protein
MTQAISYKSCRLALAVTVYCALAGHALAQSTAEVPKAIFVEVETLYDFDEGSVHSIDDLGIGNRQSAILAALGELRGKYMDLPEAEFAISNAIKGIEEAGQDILSSSEWTTHSNAPFFLNRGIVSTETAAPQTDLAETTFWGQSGADWLAASGGMPGQVTALWSDEGFKARMVQPQSPEEWQTRGHPQRQCQQRDRSRSEWQLGAQPRTNGAGRHYREILDGRSSEQGY